MNNQWIYKFSKLSQKDMQKIDRQIELRVYNVLDRVILNPLPKSEGGYGNPLHKPLQNCFKIKLKADGVRVTYKIDREHKEIHIIVIGPRNDNEAYDETERRLALDLEYDL